MIELDLEQGSLEWHQERAGRVTGTSLKSALGAKFTIKSGWTIGDKNQQETLTYELIAERMTEVQIVELNTAAVERGRELEPFAIKHAAIETGEDYQDCGMLICESMQDFGFSPDAVVKNDGVVIGGLETKCPSSKKHVEYLIKDEIPNEYYWQVLAPFICSDSIQWWDFASYDDRNYEKPLFVKRVNRADVLEIIEKAKAELKQYLKSVCEKHEELVF
jgi:hypothetical protein